MAFPPELLDPRMALYWVSVPLQAALALATLLLAPGDPRHRTFAILVACNAAWDLSEGLAVVSTGAAASANAAAGDHFAIWTALALAAFLLVYPTPRALARRTALALAGAALVASLLLTFDRSLYAQRGTFGPLRLVLVLWFPLLSVGAFLLLRDAARGSAERAFPRAIVAAALLVYPLGTLVDVLGPEFWTRLVPTIPRMLVDAARWPQAVVAATSLAAVLAAPVLAAWAVTVAARFSRRAGLALSVALGLLAVLDVLGAAAIAPGATSLTFALLVAYALARAKLFDIDLKVKWSMKKGTLAGAFVGVGLLVSEVVAQQLVSERLGAVAGVIAAGLLLLVFSPLRRLTDRLVDRAMPGVRPTPDYLEERKHAVYRAALEGARADGVVTARERRVLDRLAEELGLGPNEKAALEAAPDQAGKASSSPGGGDA